MTRFFQPKGAHCHLPATAVCIIALMSAGAVNAQTAATPAPAAAGTSDPKPDDHGLQEIVVTAQRRSESAQRVPISVQAFSTGVLTANAISNTSDLSTLVTGLTIVSAGAREPVYLRGVGNSNVASSSAVLTFIDGVYQPFNNGPNSFSDIAGIEVAKGPQGTLFGRNATGGVIQITTREPADHFEADAKVGYANYNAYSGSAYVGGALAPNVKASLTGFYDKQVDGWGTNLATGKDILTSRGDGARAKVILDVSENTTIKISGDYLASRGNDGSMVTQAPGSPPLYNYITNTTYTYPSIYDVSANWVPGYHAEEGGGSITIDQKIGSLSFLSISSARKDRVYTQVDYDGSSIPFLNITRIDRAWDVTQEFQIKSPSNNHFNWVAGLFYYHNSSQLAPFGFSGSGPGSPPPAGFGVPPGDTFNIYAFDQTDAYAAYGQATFELLPDTRLTLGARYTIEHHDQHGYNTYGVSNTAPGTIIPATVGQQSVTFRKPTFRAALDHRFNRDFMIYASYNRSFNAGYFNTSSAGGFTAQENPVIQPEVIDAYETGFKSELFDRRLRINVAAFQYNYSNLQEQIYRGNEPETINAASARIKGVDVDVEARPTQHLGMTFSVEYLDPKYLSFPNAPLYSLAPNGALLVGTGDATGYSTANAPHFSFNGGANYNIPSSIGPFDLNASINYRGKMYADSFEFFPLKTRYLLSSSIRWTSRDTKTSILLWGKNLINQKYDESYDILDPIGAGGQPGAPRTYGFTFERKY